MGANTLHLKGGEALTAPIQTARFVCKAERVRELTDTLPHMARQSPFHVVKVIELTQAQYQHYAAHLGEKAPFITANRCDPLPADNSSEPERRYAHRRPRL